MANLNKVMLIGRLTRDPEIHTFSNGGKVARIGFAVNNRKKDPSSGEWIDEPCFLDLKAFNRGESGQPGRKLADLVEQYLKKGHQAYIEGHLVMEQWEDKNGGGKRSAIKVIVEDVQFLEPKSASGEGMTRAPRAIAPQRQPTLAGTSTAGSFNEDSPEDMQSGSAAGEPEGEIPF